MGETNDQQRATEVRRIRKLLNQMGRLCEHATLTGALSGGATDVVNIYNQAIRTLSDLEVKVTPLFAELPSDATYDRVGVSSKLLAGYIEEDEEIEASRRHGHQNIIIGGLGNLGDLDKLKEVGVNIRENLADLVKNSVDKVKVVIDANAEVKPAPQSPPAPAPMPTGEPEKSV